MPADGLFDRVFSTPAMLAAVGDAAWVRAMLEVEAALAGAGADAGLVPRTAADAIGRACRQHVVDPAELGTASVASGNPVVPLVRALTAVVPADAAGYVHWGATSQDVLDTAMMLVVRDGVGLVRADLARAAAACAELAERHRSTLMCGRTLLQPALPIPFGLKAAGWLAAVVDAAEQLAEVAGRDLAVQLGGAAGTLAALGDAGPAVLAAFAHRLELAEPVLPWHTARARIVRLGAALGVATGTAAKVTLDVALLMQPEIGEAAEPAAPGRGASSTMPHKRNPVAAAAVAACARRSSALVSVLLAAMAQEHERALGGWQVEWQTVTELLRATGGAAGRLREVVSGLEVHADRMRANLDAAGGLPQAEHVMMALAGPLGRLAAQDAVEAAVRRAAAAGRDLRAELGGDPTISAHLGPAELAAALDPAGYLGAAPAFIDRALARYHSARGGGSRDRGPRPDRG